MYENPWRLHTIPQGVLLVASIVTAFVYLVAKTLQARRPTNKAGDPIPDGPVGLPIVGKLSRIMEDLV